MRHLEKQAIARVSTYDRTNGVIVSAIMIVGFLVTVLFVIWWTQKHRTTLVQPEPVTPGKFFEVSLDEVELNAIDFPLAAAPKFKDELALVTDAVSTVKANEFVKSDFESLVDTDGTREVGPVGDGIGDGDVPGDPNSTPAHKRWSVLYDQFDLATYRTALDYFKIEIGVVYLTNNRILRVAGIADAPVVTESNRAAESTSFYFQNEKSTARRWHRILLRELKIDLAESATVHFYPEFTLEQLRNVEADRVREDGKEIEDVRKTQFAIVKSGSQFAFQVATIEYEQ